MLLCITHWITNIVYVINGDTHSYRVTIVIRKLCRQEAIINRTHYFHSVDRG